MLAVNTFEPWRAHCEQLELAGVRSFKKIAFEKKCPTGLAGNAPHLDLVAETTNAVVAVESKCLEYLNPDVRKLSHFAPSYSTLADSTENEAGSATHLREHRVFDISTSRNW